MLIRPYISATPALSVPAVLKVSNRPLGNRQEARTTYGTTNVDGPVDIRPARNRSTVPFFPDHGSMQIE